MCDQTTKILQFVSGEDSVLTERGVDSSSTDGGVFDEAIHHTVLCALHSTCKETGYDVIEDPTFQNGVYELFSVLFLYSVHNLPLCRSIE